MYDSDTRRCNNRDTEHCTQALCFSCELFFRKYERRTVRDVSTIAQVVDTVHGCAGVVSVENAVVPPHVQVQTLPRSQRRQFRIYILALGCLSLSCVISVRYLLTSSC